MARAEQELDILERISQILGDGLELTQVFARAMSLLSDRLNVQRASLVLWDEALGQARIVASVGMTPDEAARGRYALGEGITGRVLESAQPQIIRDVSQVPDFLNRTGGRPLRGPTLPPPALASGVNGSAYASTATATLNPPAAAGARLAPTSFICVPVKSADRVVGAISVDKPFVDEPTLYADARLLAIIAGSIAQTIRIHELVRVEKEGWLAENEALRDSLRSKYRFDNIIGSSQAMLDVLATIGQVAPSRATVLLLGETGCGKELLAKALHYNSPRKDRAFIRVNCGALAPQLLESELFGHVRGAFTGAIKDKLGRFEAADGGSIFLDEVGTLDPQLQIKLLRVLQERELERVGDHRTVKVDVRVIAATNLNLEAEVRRGTFREDLYYRLNVVTINLPPLRGRREDIPRLIDHFLDRYNRENARSVRKISRDVMNTLLRYPWPGNVRELENAIERAVVLSQGDDFSEDLLPLQIRLFAQQGRRDAGDQSIEGLAAKLAEHALAEYETREGEIYDLVVGQVERQLIRESLDRHAGVKTRTADFLGINRNTLNKKVKEYAIEAGGDESPPRLQ